MHRSARRCAASLGAVHPVQHARRTTAKLGVCYVAAASGEMTGVQQGAAATDTPVPQGPSSLMRGVVHRIGSPDELKAILRRFGDADNDALVCLMCKAAGEGLGTRGWGRRSEVDG